jgi:hypothetical protein
VIQAGLSFQWKAFSVQQSVRMESKHSRELLMFAVVQLKQEAAVQVVDEVAPISTFWLAAGFHVWPVLHSPPFHGR